MLPKSQLSILKLPMFLDCLETSFNEIFFQVQIDFFSSDIWPRVGYPCLSLSKIDIWPVLRDTEHEKDDLQLLLLLSWCWLQQQKADLPVDKSSRWYRIT